MEEKRTYVKLKDLVDSRFTVTEAYGYQWKKWDPEANRMLVEEKYTDGYQKRYSLVTDKGGLEVGSGQLANLLEAVYSKGKADLVNRTFNVKSNGKSGMDIRYYFNAERLEQPTTGLEKAREAHAEIKQRVEAKKVDEVYEEEEPINLADIPF